MPYSQGSAQGAGLAIVKKFVNEGAKVVATDMNEEKPAVAIKDLKNNNIRFIKHNVSSPDDWRKVVSFAVNEFGGINVLVNNAGITSGKNIEIATAEDFDRVLKVNTFGAFYGIKAVLPEFAKQPRSAIVNIDSIDGIVADDADGHDAPYSASKGATRTLTKHCAVELAAKNIRANSVHPDPVLTPMVEEKLKTTAPLPSHHNEPDDVANAVLFLASDESKAMTGAELVIDMGYTAS